MINTFLCKTQALSTQNEQNSNLDKYHLQDEEWTLLVDMKTYLDIWRRFAIEIDVESCESGSRIFGALKGLEGQLRSFQERKPHIKPFIDRPLYIVNIIVKNESFELQWAHMMGNRFIAIQTIYAADLSTSR